MLIRHRPRYAGFTLIEVMVVIVIIGVMASMAVVSVTLGDPRRDLRNEAERLRTVLALAAEEAVIQQVELGAEFTEAGYRFLRWEQPPQKPRSGSASNPPPIDPETGMPMKPKAEWVILTGDEILREYELPQGMRMLVQVDFEAVDIAAQSLEKSRLAGNAPVVPTLLFLSSGETTPFRIELLSDKAADTPLFIEGSVIGQVGVTDEASP